MDQLKDMLLRDHLAESEVGSAGNWHDRYIKPWGSAYPRVRQEPNIAQRFLFEGLPQALMGMRSPGGAGVMRNSIISRQLENAHLKALMKEAPAVASMGSARRAIDAGRSRPMAWSDEAITGGAPPDLAAARLQQGGMMPTFYTRSATGLAERNPEAIRSAVQGVNYPRFKYQGRGAANENRGVGQGLGLSEFERYQDAIAAQRQGLTLQEWERRLGLGSSGPPSLRVIEGGRGQGLFPAE